MPPAQNDSLYMTVERRAWFEMRTDLEKANELQSYYKRIAEE
jgi:hypothetical protein